MSDAKHKQLTFISRSAPYGSDRAQVCLDMVLASSVFEQNVNYLFIEDGVYQLLDGQQPEGIADKSLLASLGALDLYGVEKVFVDSQSLKARGIQADRLGIEVKVIGPEQVKQLVTGADVVFSL